MRRSVLLAVVLLALAGCSGGSQAATAAAPTLPTTTSSAPVTSSPAAVSTNSHGNVPKTLGQQAWYASTDGKTKLVTFSIDSITVDPHCDSGFQDPPVNGHFLAIAIRASTSPALPSDYTVTFQDTDFKVIGPDGITRSNQLGNGSSCLATSEQFPVGQLGPGQQYTGTVVLDSPVTHGSLIYAPGMMGGTHGWEWQF